MFKTFLIEQDEDSVIKSIKKVIKIDDHGELDDGLISVQLSKGTKVEAKDMKFLSKTGISVERFYTNAGSGFIDFRIK